MNYFTRVAIVVDQLAATVFFGTMPDETLSAAAHRRGWKRTERLINRLFNDPSHCHDAYIAELRGDHHAKIYQQE